MHGKIYPLIVVGAFSVLPGFGWAEPANPIAEAAAKMRAAMQREASGIATEHLGAQRAWTLWRQYKETGDGRKLAEIREQVKANDPGALNVMGYLRAEGVEGVGKDSRQAANLFRRAATEGRLPVASYNLGLLTLKGEGVGANTKEAMTLFATAAPIVPQAAVRLALLHIEEGKYQDAWRVARMAAQRGDPWGNYLCGKLAAMGSVGDVGSGVVADYLRRATEYWHPDAANLMAELTEKSSETDKTGMARIHAGMYRIIAQAIRMPQPMAAARSGLPASLSSEEAEKATSLAINWLNTHPKPAKPRNYNRPLPVPDA